MPDVDAALEHVRTHRDAFLDLYKETLAIPSISTLPDYQPQVEQMARWLAARLEHLGMQQVEVIPTAGHPIVYGERLGAPGKPTALVYGHYDVQPADPLDEWNSDPFDPVIEDDNIYARGASDMKGQLLAHLAAIEALVQQGELPVNVKYLLEGEEEIGSPSLDSFLEEHGGRLACDFVINCDSGIHAPDQPAIVYALRGLAYFELEVRGPEKDLHSGLFGGVVNNPANALCRLLAGMHDANGRITLPGFYDSVRHLDDEERAELAKQPCDDTLFLETTGAPALWGEEGYTAVERVSARPALDVNGIFGGFTGAGAKTVLPACATAKLSMRLVADQRTEDVADQLRAYVREHTPDSINWEVRELSHGPSAIMDRQSPWMRAAVEALTDVFRTEPIFKREGGSVPVVGVLQQQLGVDSVMLGFALPDDGIHGPNEKQHLPTLFRGIETHVRFLAALGELDTTIP